MFTRNTQGYDRSDPCSRYQPNILCRALLGIATIFTPILATADNNDFGGWALVTATDTFRVGDEPSRWHYWVDAHARYFDVGSGINQYLVRPAVGYQLADNLQVWVGYARVRSRNATGMVTDENRTWQQLNWTAGHWGSGNITMRARLLQRSVDTGNDVGLLLRVLTKYTRPIGIDGKKSLVVSVEPFFDFRDTDWGGDSGIAQNRTFVGVGWHLREKLTIETGYMNQFVWNDNAENTSNHLGVVNFKVKF